MYLSHKAFSNEKLLILNAYDFRFASLALAQLSDIICIVYLSQLGNKAQIVEHETQFVSDLFVYSFMQITLFNLTLYFSFTLLLKIRTFMLVIRV